MLKQYWLISLFLLLLVSHLLLYLVLRDKSSKLDLAHKILSDTEAIVYYSESNKREFQHPKDNFEALNASKYFFQLIDSLRHSLGKTYNQQPVRYFSVSKSDTRSQELRLAFQKLDLACRKYLEFKVQKSVKMLKELKDNSSRMFRSVVNRANQSPNNVRKHVSFPLRFSSVNEQKISIDWMKKNDSIHWGQGKLIYENYIFMLEARINSPHAFQAKQILLKFSKTFSKPNKISVYEVDYDITYASPAELESICKYLLLLQTDLEKELILTHSELFFQE